MKNNKRVIFGTILILLTISPILITYSPLILFNNNNEYLNYNHKNLDNTQTDASKTPEIEINNILFDISTMKIREDKKIEFLIKWKNFDDTKKIFKLLKIII